MEALRKTGSLPSSPSRISGNKLTEISATVNKAMPSSRTAMANGGSDNRSYHAGHSNDTENVQDGSGDIQIDKGMEQKCDSPPNIRRRARQTVDRKQVGDLRNSKDLFFADSMNSNEAADGNNRDNGVTNHARQNISTFSPIKPPRKTRPIIRGCFAASPTCRAQCLLVFTLLLLCALLSHYFTSEQMIPPSTTDNREAPTTGSTAMTLSEQQILLTAYLGDPEGSFSASLSNVKLPAGGNPIDLVRLLHSRIIEKEERADDDFTSSIPHTVDVSANAVLRPSLRLMLMLFFLCLLATHVIG